MAKSIIPGLSQWSTFAGGTAAAPGKHGYDYRVAGQTFTIQPVSNQYGRHQGYTLTAYPGVPARGYQRIGGIHRSPQKAVSAARVWAGGNLGREQNPHVSSKWVKATIRRLPKGKIQVKVFGAGRSNNPDGGAPPALSGWSKAPDPNYGDRLLYWHMTDVGEYLLKPRYTIKGNRPIYSAWRGSVFISNHPTAAKAAAAARAHYKWYRATKG